MMPRVSLDGLWPDDEQLETTHDGAHFRMASSREYVVSSSLLRSNPTILADAAVPFTRHIDEHPEEQPVVFTTYNAERILSRPPIPFSERAWLLARAIARRLEHRPGNMHFELSPHVPLFLWLLRDSYVSATSDFVAMLQYWAERGVLEFRQTLDGFVDIDLPVRGLIEIEEAQGTVESDSAFVAMWFAPEMSAAYEEGIAPAVEKLGFRPVRIDRREHNNKIDDEIIAEIRRAHFLIADFSCGPDGARGGVYYEAGFAAGAGKPVIYMVREGDLPRVHFDTRQFNHIVWVSHDDLRTRLANRIGATIGARSGAVA